MPINPDRQIFLVLCRYESGPAWAERDLGRTNRADTIEDIRSGELPNVMQVIELNPVEFSSRDITAEMVVEARAPEIRSKLLAQLARQDHERALMREGV